MYISFWHASQSYGVIPVSEKQTHVKISFLSYFENAATVTRTDYWQFKEAGHAIYPSTGNASIHTIHGALRLTPFC